MRFLINFLAFFILINSQAKEDFKFKTEIEEIIKEYLLKNPQILIESLENYRSNQEIRLEKNRENLINSYYKNKEYNNLPNTGNTEGNIIIMEFIDYNCGYCKKTLKTINKLIKKYQNIKFVFIDFPILSETSLLAAKAAIAAFNQNLYFEYHSALLNNRKNIDETYLLELAKSFNLSLDKFKSDMESEKTNIIIEKNIEFAKNLNIRGTPTFIINKKVYPGAYDMKKIEDILNKN